MINFAAQYGVQDGQDITAQLTQLSADLDALTAAGKVHPGVLFPAGKFTFSNWPLRAANRMQIFGGNTFLLHTGSGDAITIDGGQNGVFNCDVAGFTIVPGPQTQNSLVLRSFHHSRVDVRVHGAGAGFAAVSMLWNVCTELRAVVSVNEASIDSYPITRPCVGILLDANPAGSPNRTTACVIRQPILEGLNKGIVIQGADFCTINGAGGTIEDGVDGIVFPDGDWRPGNHVISRMEMEANTGWDVYFGSNAHNNRVVYSGNPKLKVYNASATLKELLPNNKVISTTDLL